MAEYPPRLTSTIKEEKLLPLISVDHPSARSSNDGQQLGGRFLNRFPDIPVWLAITVGPWGN